MAAVLRAQAPTEEEATEQAKGLMGRGQPFTIGVGHTPAAPPGLGAGYIGPTQAEQDLEKQYGGITTRLQERVAPIQRRIGEIEGEIGAATDELGAVSKSYLDRLRPTPSFQPRQIDQQEMTNFAGVAMALAGLGAAVLRAPISAGLNAAGAAMKGFQQGNLQQAKLDIENFRTKMEEVKALNDTILKERQAIMDDRKLTLAQKQNMLRVLYHKYQDEVGIAAAQKGDLKFQLDRMANERKAQNAFTQSFEKINATLTGIQARLDNQNRAPRTINTTQGVMQWTDAGWVPVMGPGGTPAMPPSTKPTGDGGRPLPAKAAQDLAGRDNVMLMLDDLIAQQEAAIKKGQGFGGYGFDAMGNAAIKASRATGTNPDEVNFFAALETVAQPDRHALFGATLTGNELNSWRTGWVGAGDNPQTLLNVLKQKRKMYEQMRSSKTSSYRRMGFQVDGTQPPAEQTDADANVVNNGLTPAEAAELEQLRKRFGR